MREPTFTNAICKAESKQISKDFAYCEDTISRQAAIDVADAVWSVTGDKNVAKVWDQIKDLPSAQLELANNSPKVGKENGEWIPCSEKLPENGHYYLWCSDGGNVQSDYYWDGFENGKKFGYNIIAWMPLPKPYKEEQE